MGRGLTQIFTDKKEDKWKGKASYYSIEVNGKVNENAAWYYPKPRDAAEHIAGYVAFWRGVEVKG